MHSRGPSCPPVETGRPRIRRSPREFSFFHCAEGGASRGYAGISFIATILRRPHLAPSHEPRFPRKTKLWLRTPATKANTRHPLSLFSPGAILSKSTGTSISLYRNIYFVHTIQFQVFSLSAALFENWRYFCAASPASGILTAHRLCKTGLILGIITLPMAVTRPLSFKPPPDGHTSPTVAVTHSQIAFILNGAACRSMHCDSSG